MADGSTVTLPALPCRPNRRKRRDAKSGSGGKGHRRRRTIAPTQQPSGFHTGIVVIPPGREAPVFTARSPGQAAAGTPSGRLLTLQRCGRGVAYQQRPYLALAPTRPQSPPHAPEAATAASDAFCVLRRQNTLHSGTLDYSKSGQTTTPTANAEADCEHCCLRMRRTRFRPKYSGGKVTYLVEAPPWGAGRQSVAVGRVRSGQGESSRGQSQ